ncbi:MAG: hypothetical protein IT374_07130 [Polyangiaceae bacterium]|nr:hypothetical protein [Polyangiaceae bacterium]
MLSEEELLVVLERQKRDGRRLGTLLVEAGLVNETQLTQILSQQLSAPWVSLYHIDFSRQLLNLVPRAVVEQFCLVPIYVRHVRKQGETLYVAMDDPSNEEALKVVAEAAGLPVRAMIAPPSDIRNAIRVYYGGGRGTLPSVPPDALRNEARGSSGSEPVILPADAPPEVEELDIAPDPTPDPPAASLADTPPEEAPPPRQPMPAVPAMRGELHSVPVSFDDEGPEVAVREVPVPAKLDADEKAKRMARMMALTFLDGTTVALPRRKPRGPAPDEPPESGEPKELLTARDIVAALRASAYGADASEILGDNARWEKMVATLLSLLLRKHLIADWEFIEELNKI